MIRQATWLQAVTQKLQIHRNGKLGMDWQRIADTVPEMNPLQCAPCLFDCADELEKLKAQLGMAQKTLL